MWEKGGETYSCPDHVKEISRYDDVGCLIFGVAPHNKDASL